MDVQKPIERKCEVLEIYLISNGEAILLFTDNLKRTQVEVSDKILDFVKN